ncbi:MarR family transcriptional regulator [Bradyrhizobium sp. DOA1]|uniref:MarR family winged helix-turn-helix transcriptional regulator n=1 Tax=Bradyrhizobium sp. DOA1 TaxID=1126616 RepID=UPI00077CB06E|nr:MarR family transcriptional regulator [Bradyrhizobium sp. DOA1]KYH01821.1 transcriptional regulator [Bradyrhizobium sp. DOA1]
MRPDKLDKAVDVFIWNIIEIHSQLEDIHSSWAKLLGVTEPQWLMLMGITELDIGKGVSGTDLAKKLRVHPSFVTGQAKILEKQKLILRQPRSDDARFVLMSLSPKAKIDFEKISEKMIALNLTLLKDLNEEVFVDLNTTLAAISKNARLGSQLLAIDIDTTSK